MKRNEGVRDAQQQNRLEETYEHVLMCLICRSLFDDGDHQPKFLPCHHTFCKDCLREYVVRLGDDSQVDALGGFERRLVSTVVDNRSVA